MGKKFLFYLLIALLLSVTMSDVYAQNKSDRKVYIEKYKDLAIREMRKYHIPASIILSQALLESNNGNSKLSRKANNHFGIKAFKDWNGKTIRINDDRRREKFRKYPSAKDSYRDHSLFLKNKKRYSFLFNYKITDYSSWAYGLTSAGYATNKRYARLLVKIIEENNLSDFDKLYSSDKTIKRSGKKIIRPVKKIKVPEKKVAKNINGEDFEKVSLFSEKRKVYKNNRAKYIIAGNDDTFKCIAKEFEIGFWELLKCNDLKKSREILSGEKIYIKYKKNYSYNKRFHIALENESMYLISQEYGIKLRSLLKMNNMKKGDILKPGKKILLRNTGKKRFLFF